MSFRNSYFKFGYKTFILESRIDIVEFDYIKNKLIEHNCYIIENISPNSCIIQIPKDSRIIEVFIHFEINYKSFGFHIQDLYIPFGSDFESQKIVKGSIDSIGFY